MTRKQKRLVIIGGGVTFIVAAVLLVMVAFSQAIAYFYVPGDLAKADLAPGTRIRLGGLVEQGSVKRDGLTVSFIVTDLARAVPVRYEGILPDLFKEGKGVVAQGQVGGDGVFVAREVLAKHDENYMPPEASAALKRAGTTLPNEAKR